MIKTNDLLMLSATQKKLQKHKTSKPHWLLKTETKHKRPKNGLSLQKKNLNQQINNSKIKNKNSINWIPKINKNEHLLPSEIITKNLLKIKMNLSKKNSKSK